MTPQWGEKIKDFMISTAATRRHARADLQVFQYCWRRGKEHRYKSQDSDLAFPKYLCVNYYHVCVT